MYAAIETYKAPNGREMELPVLAVMPTSGEVDDSRMHIWVPGYGEPIEHSSMVAQVLADELGTPVGTYQQPIGGYIQKPRRDVPVIYRDGLRVVHESLAERFENAETFEVTAHSIGGLAVGYELEDEPDKYRVIELVKAIGTTNPNGNTDAEGIREQLSRSSYWKRNNRGLELLRNFTGPAQIGTVLRAMREEPGHTAVLARNAGRESFKQLFQRGPATVVGLAATVSEVDIGPALEKAGKHARIGAVAAERDSVINAQLMTASLVGRKLVDHYVIIDSEHIPMASKQGLEEVRLVAGAVLHMRGMQDGETYINPDDHKYVTALAA